MEKPRLEADSWSFDEDEPDIKHEHVCSIVNFSKKMKMPQRYGHRWAGETPAQEKSPAGHPPPSTNPKHAADAMSVIVDTCYGWQRLL